ncbi:MAG: hypothetical protein HGB12_16810 [Bacteroidetes bacterium]|nr:hypothetical protein [Bacteroidota bacterium]
MKDIFSLYFHNDEKVCKDQGIRHGGISLSVNDVIKKIEIPHPDKNRYSE